MNLELFIWGIIGVAVFGLFCCVFDLILYIRTTRKIMDIEAETYRQFQLAQAASLFFPYKLPKILD